MIDPTLDLRLEHLLATEGRNSKVYPKFVDAFRRLAASPQQPVEDPEFVEMAAEEKRIKVTIANVAREGGVNPQRFTGGKSDFKQLSALVKSYRPSLGVSENTTLKIERQATTIGDLEQMLKVVRSRLAEAIILKDEALLDLQEARDEISRIKKRMT